VDRVWYAVNLAKIQRKKDTILAETSGLNDSLMVVSENVLG
jgi:hypothetical protein